MLSTLYQITTLSVSVVAALVAFAYKEFSLLVMAVIFLLTYGILQYFNADVKVVAPVLTFLYVLAYFGVFSVVQIAIVASMVAVLFAFKDGKVKLAGNWYNTLFFPLRHAGLAAVIAVAPVLAMWLAKHAVLAARKSLVFGLLVLASALYVIGLLLGFVKSFDSAALASMAYGFTEMKISTTSPITWVGLIAWEELFTRPLGGIGNAFFAILHIPTRFANLDALTAMLVIVIIAIGTTWLVETYQRGGLIGAIIGHAVYNATVTAIATSKGLAILFPIIIGAALYIMFNRPQED